MAQAFFGNDLLHVLGETLGDWANPESSGIMQMQCEDLKFSRVIKTLPFHEPSFRRLTLLTVTTINIHRLNRRNYGYVNRTRHLALRNR